MFNSAYTREVALGLNIRSDAVNRLADKLASFARVSKLASFARVSKTEAVRIALVNALERRERARPLAERLQPLLARIASVRDTGLPADTAFFFETVAALSRKKAQPVADSEAQVQEFLTWSHIRIVAVAEPEITRALAAFRRYGKGSGNGSGKGQGHPAQLNMGDCFAFACAQANDVPMLFVGSDFSKTDIRAALI